MGKIITVFRDGSATEISDAEPGRPTDDPKDERVDVRLNAREKALFLKRGGSAWLRKKLKEAS